MTKVESLNPLRTLHNAVPLKEMDSFFDKVIGQNIEVLVPPVSAPSRNTSTHESNVTDLTETMKKLDSWRQWSVTGVRYWNWFTNFFKSAAKMLKTLPQSKPLLFLHCFILFKYNFVQCKKNVCYANFTCACLNCHQRVSRTKKQWPTRLQIIHRICIRNLSSQCSIYPVHFTECNVDKKRT